MKRASIQRFVLAAALLGASPAWSAKVYTRGAVAPAPVTGGGVVCLAGGASDDLWAEGWRLLLTQAAGGNVVIVRADGSRGGYEDWIFDDEGHHHFPAIASMTTIVFEGRADADRDDVVAAVDRASLIFFAGGDQARYVDWFQGSRFASAVARAVRERKAAVGGTSAGMALLGGIVYAARGKAPGGPEAEVSSSDALGAPAAPFVDLAEGFLAPPFLDKTVTDTHFSQRGREGRLVAFMARAAHDGRGGAGPTSVRGLAADAGTAVCYGESGVARVFGSGRAFFLQGAAPIGRLREGAGLDWNSGHGAVRAYSIKGGSDGRFDLKSWSGTGGESRRWFVDGSDPAAPKFGIE